MKLKWFRWFLFVVWFDLMAHPAVDIRLESINKEIARSPSNVSLYFHKAEIQRKNRDYTVAEQTIEHALKLGANQSLYLFHMAKLARDQGHVSKAFSFLTEAIETNSHQQRYHSALLYIELAELYSLSNQWSKAANSYFKALQIHQEVDPGIYLLTSQLFVLTDESNLKPALQVIDMGLKQYPGRLCFHKQGIELALAGQQYRDAIKRLSDLAKTHPGLSSKAEQFARLSCNQPLTQQQINKPQS